MGSSVGRGNQYIQLVKALYCKLPTISKQLPTFPHKVQGQDCQSQKWEVKCVTTVPPLPVMTNNIMVTKYWNTEISTPGSGLGSHKNYMLKHTAFIYFKNGHIFGLAMLTISKYLIFATSGMCPSTKPLQG